MRNIKIVARQVITESVNAESIAAALCGFRLKHPSAIIEAVADREFIGFCDGFAISVQSWRLSTLLEFARLSYDPRTNADCDWEAYGNTNPYARCSSRWLAGEINSRRKDPQLSQRSQRGSEDY